MAININLAAIKSVMLGTVAIQMVAVGTNIVWQNEITKTISANAQQVDSSTLFTADEWAATTDKRVKVAASIWSYTDGVPALKTGTGRGGKLTIEVTSTGAVYGSSGLANGGVGGTAILVQQGNTYIINAGNIYAGGGGGGVGGQGGPGNYASPYTYTEGPTVTPNTQTSSAYRYTTDSSTAYAWWGGALNAAGRVGSAPIGQGQIVAGGWRYYPGAYYQAVSGGSVYYISRDQTRYNYPTTNGGAGGAGGRGYGLNAAGSNIGTGGSSGAGGGTNAGTGGTGGSGGGWGASGGAGNSGASGNTGSGSGGGAGGLAGFYISGMANVANLNNTGSVLGRAA